MSAVTTPRNQNSSARSSMWEAGACWWNTSRHRSVRTAGRRSFHARRWSGFDCLFVEMCGQSRRCRWMSLRWHEAKLNPVVDVRGRSRRSACMAKPARLTFLMHRTRRRFPPSHWLPRFQLASGLVPRHTRAPVHASTFRDAFIQIQDRAGNGIPGVGFFLRCSELLIEEALQHAGLGRARLPCEGDAEGLFDFLFGRSR